jgi:uncharacterized protein YcaQ
MPIVLNDLRRLAVAQTLFPPTTIRRALQKLRFVQADPIRAPARAQDLILRHRVKDYRAGDLERRYSKLGIAEDFFINYGFVTTSLQALMHPRSESCVPAEGVQDWPTARRKQALLLLDFVRERGPVHPREVDDHFSHGTVKNYWGGSSNATTHLLDALHYQGLLRVVRRDAGIRIYATHEHALAPPDQAVCQERLDTLADAAIAIYAPLPGKSLNFLLRRLRFAAPQWQDEITTVIRRAKERLSHTRLDGIDWYWSSGKDPARLEPQDKVRLLAPFDPVVWDRDRFELLWGWVYRFEGYTPAPKRKRGYYALPLLWREHVIGWANLATSNGELKADVGYVKSPPRDRVFKAELEAELERVRVFLERKS